MRTQNVALQPRGTCFVPRRLVLDEAFSQGKDVRPKRGKRGHAWPAQSGLQSATLEFKVTAKVPQRPRPLGTILMAEQCPRKTRLCARAAVQLNSNSTYVIVTVTW